MGRPLGARNVDYEQTREKLSSKVLEAVVKGGAQVSLHELAREAEVSIPTLKHYFGDRSGALAEALRSARSQASPYLVELSDPKKLGLTHSLKKVATDLASAWVPFGVGKVFSQGLSVGLFDSVAGPGYLDGVLEPTVLAMEARLKVHAFRKEIDLEPTNEFQVRTAALAFLSPLLVALIHQHGLGGTQCRPLDIDRFIEEHIRRFVAAYGPVGSAPG